MMDDVCDLELQKVLLVTMKNSAINNNNQDDVDVDQIPMPTSNNMPKGKELIKIVFKCIQNAQEVPEKYLAYIRKKLDAADEDSEGKVFYKNIHDSDEGVMLEYLLSQYGDTDFLGGNLEN
jgi:hypothetical protein